jgi:hypothetical protein
MKLSDLWPRAAGDLITEHGASSAPDSAPAARVKLGRPAPKPIQFPTTLAECQVLEEKLGRDAISLEANIRLTENGRHDETWGYRARAALKHMNRDRQALMVHMKTVRLEERSLDPIWNSYEKLLVRILTERVSPELMDECKQMAQQQVDHMRAKASLAGVNL